MSEPIYSKIKPKKRFNRLLKMLSSPLHSLRCRRPANVDFILNRQDYGNYS
jgi:hypothetical protein